MERMWDGCSRDRRLQEALLGAPDPTLIVSDVSRGTAARIISKTEQDSKKGSRHLPEPHRATTHTLGVAKLQSR